MVSGRSSLARPVARLSAVEIQSRPAVERQLARLRRATSWTMNWFPVRVWRRVLAYNGLLLSAGVSYEALFATFAALYLGLAVFGVWFVADQARLDSLIDIINTYIPGFVGDSGAVSRQQLIDLAQQNLAQFGWGSLIALGVLIWTASSWITYSRMAIRTVYGLEKDPRSYVMLKSRDVLVSIILGAVLLAGAILATASTNLFGTIAHWLGIEHLSDIAQFSARVVGLALVFLLDAVVLCAMFMLLAGANITLRQVLGGAAMGGLALTVLQVLGSFVLSGGTKNPLLATFIVFVTLLLWFRITAVVILTAAAWVAEAAIDRGHPLESRAHAKPGWASAAR